MNRLVCIGVLLCLAGGFLWGGSAEEASASPERGRYFIDQGKFIPPEEIIVDSYIASIDMGYVQPDDPIGITFLPGSWQVSADGEEMVFLIGIQGRRMSYMDLPTVNQSLLVDKSGSMFQKNKLEWVKQSCEYFLDTVREKDYLSVITYDESARVLFPSSLMASANERSRVREVINAIVPGGGSNIRSALELGFLEVLANADNAVVNRVVLMTDGIGKTEGVLELVDEYHGKGIEVSAIGFGEDFDSNFMRQLVRRGGGTSRFVSGREAMEEMFGTGFTRMTFPAARDLDLQLEFLTSAGDVETWAFNYELSYPWSSYAEMPWREAEQGSSQSNTDRAPDPYDIAIDSEGSYFISDRASARVQVFTEDGRFIREWGSSFFGDSSLSKPGGIAIHPNGTVYVADQGNGRVIAFDRNGVAKDMLRRSLFWSPQDVAVDEAGNVYVVDQSRNIVSRFDPSGRLTSEWGDSPDRIGVLDSPSSVAVGPYGNVYVVDQGNRRIAVYESDGTPITAYGGVGTYSPLHGIDIDEEGTIYVTALNGNVVLVLDINGVIQRSFTVSHRDRRISGPAAIVATPGGRVAICDSALNSVYRYSADGVLLYEEPIKYTYKTVNFDDYETILVRAKLAGKESPGVYDAAVLKGSYTDNAGVRRRIEPITLRMNFTDGPIPVQGVSDPYVLRAGTMLEYADTLKQISILAEMEEYQQALELAKTLWAYMDNAEIRLGGELFTEEKNLLRTYAAILLPGMGREAEAVDEYLTVEDLEVKLPQIPLNDRLLSLFREVGLRLNETEGVSLGIFGFRMGDESQNGFTRYLDRTAESLLYGLPGLKLVDRTRLEAVITEQKLVLSGLVDLETATQVGDLVSADFLITGSVIPMNESAAVFCRLIDTSTGSLDSVAQVFVPLDADVRSMMR